MPSTQDHWSVPLFMTKTSLHTKEAFTLEGYKHTHTHTYIRSKKGSTCSWQHSRITLEKNFINCHLERKYQESQILKLRTPLNIQPIPVFYFWLVSQFHSWLIWQFHFFSLSLSLPLSLPYFFSLSISLSLNNLQRMLF